MTWRCGDTQKEPLNSFAVPVKNGLLSALSEKECGGGGGGTDEKGEEELVHELQQQVAFLQAQLEDRDRAVRQLEGRMAKFSLGAQLARRNGGTDHKEIVTCNAATQTDRVSYRL